MPLHPADLRSEENVEISDDSCLSSDNRFQQSLRKGWSPYIHLGKNKMIWNRRTRLQYTVALSDSNHLYG